MNQFRLNAPTPLDFLLHFTIGEKDFLVSQNMRPEVLANMAVPLLHFALSQYNLSRLRYSSLAIAAVCYIIQENAEAAKVREIKQARDKWLSILITKFEDIDPKEVFETLWEFSRQATGN
jgi:hypothetical protein